jgi:DNA-binding GntR family transcriptional regulator
MSDHHSSISDEPTIATIVAATDTGVEKGARLSDRAYHELRRLIVDGELEEGERLTERALAERLEISPTPIREALQRLEHEWLIERKGPRTVVVGGANRRRLRELRVIEAALRGAAARLACENATNEELELLAGVHAEAVRVARTHKGKPDTLARVVELTRRMHALLDAASHNPVVVKMIATTMAFDFVTRVDTIKRLGKDYPARWVDDHGEIVEALRERDGDRAERLMRTHILNTGRYLASAADNE